MELLTTNNEVAGDFLNLGTKYRNRYCPDSRTDREILATSYTDDETTNKRNYNSNSNSNDNNDTTIPNTDSKNTNSNPTSIDVANQHKQQLTTSLLKTGRRFVITTTDKATGCYALICKRWYI
jgi:hypothetical protein